jgi:(E)-4-hydroxy-3-methylbut-2-enyl-diphosphate synthase
MLNARPCDVSANISQAQSLKEAGCDILRVAVPDKESAKLIYSVKERVDIPLVADIHFDYRLALEAVAAGADKIRINPGNIGGEDRVKAVADACRAKKIPIRVGVNSGSVERELLAKHGGPTAGAMAESALGHIELLERQDFCDIVISVKASSVAATVEACRAIAKARNYPMHLGVTEAGTPRIGLLRSAAGIGALLLEGIGDTIRVSLTAPPEEEVAAGRDLLKALNMHAYGVSVISCPTCGRTEIDVALLAAKVELALASRRERLSVAVMGCAVNGPGEAREADIALCGGKDCVALYVGGVFTGKFAQAEAIPALLKEFEKLTSK